MRYAVPGRVHAQFRGISLASSQLHTNIARLRHGHDTNLTIQHTRAQSTASHPLPPHSLLPTGVLLRSLLVATVSSHRILMTPALSLLQLFSKPRNALLQPKANPLLHSLLKRTLYNHVCAGENHSEVTSTIRRIKYMGFRGVILTYAKEVVVDSSQSEVGTGTQQLEEAKQADVDVSQPHYDKDIQAWRDGVLETVAMLSKGDFLALKYGVHTPIPTNRYEIDLDCTEADIPRSYRFTGAGAGVTEALSSGKPLPAQMSSALEDICEQAIRRRAMILVDAEQQFVQPGIDRAAAELMRRYNTGGGGALVYNTYQAYLKATPQVLGAHLAQARRDGFALGVKLVRGAYMSSEPRHLINDTKADTDDAYDKIAESLVDQNHQLFGFEDSAEQARVDLFLATHNKKSTLAAYEQQAARAARGASSIPVKYGQLLGMADEVSCTLLQLKAGGVGPEAYKCLSWGSLDDCLSYLIRRAVENRDAVSRTVTEYQALKREVWRRLRATVGLS